MSGKEALRVRSNTKTKWPGCDTDVAFRKQGSNFMSVIINTNMAAVGAAYNLGNSNTALQKSLTRLSSGSKIVSSSDDAGGLAVAMNLNATILSSNATITGIADANSLLQTQDGVLSVAGNVLSRMSQLKTMSNDATKSTSDISNYNAEFTALQSQLSELTASTFNGVPLFVTGGGSLAVPTSADGTTSQTITQASLYNVTSSIINNATGVTSVTTAQISTALAAVASERAVNGAQSSRLTFASQVLSVNATNLTAAVSQITDVDVATESTKLAKDNILVQAGTSMLAQANSSSQMVLKLLQQ